MQSDSEVEVRTLMQANVWRARAASRDGQQKPPESNGGSAKAVFVGVLEDQGQPTLQPPALNRRRLRWRTNLAESTATTCLRRQLFLMERLHGMGLSQNKGWTLFLRLCFCAKRQGKQVKTLAGPWSNCVGTVGCGSKNRYQNGTLVSGNMDQNLRFAPPV